MVLRNQLAVGCELRLRLALFLLWWLHRCIHVLDLMCGSTCTKQLARHLPNEQHWWLARYRTISPALYRVSKLVLEQYEHDREPTLFRRCPPARCNRLGLDSLCVSSLIAEWSGLWRPCLQLGYFTYSPLHLIPVHLTDYLGILAYRVCVWYC